MSMKTVSVTAADAADVDAVIAVLRSNREDTSLFQQPRSSVLARLHEFLLARAPNGTVLGCLQVKVHRPGYIELMAVSVVPEAKGQGVGAALMVQAVAAAVASQPTLLWLSTEKPDYFGRFGFVPFSKWSLPPGILLDKLLSVFRQPVARWLPAILGRPVFMRQPPRPQS